MWACVVVSGMAYMFWVAHPTLTEAQRKSQRGDDKLYKTFGKWLLSPGAIVSLGLGTFAALGVFAVSFLYKDAWVNSH